LLVESQEQDDDADIDVAEEIPLVASQKKTQLSCCLVHLKAHCAVAACAGDMLPFMILKELRYILMFQGKVLAGTLRTCVSPIHVEVSVHNCQPRA
jgi:hypothetical protein